MIFGSRTEPTAHLGLGLAVEDLCLASDCLKYFSSW